jgi:hypothetical protein
MPMTIHPLYAPLWVEAARTIRRPADALRSVFRCWQRRRARRRALAASDHRLLTLAVSVVSGRETIVTLQSSASSARQWDALALALAPHASVQVIDVHGHGARADWPEARR